MRSGPFATLDRELDPLRHGTKAATLSRARAAGLAVPLAAPSPAPFSALSFHRRYWQWRPAGVLSAASSATMSPV